jgi:CHAT domain-containing protein
VNVGRWLAAAACIAHLLGGSAFIQTSGEPSEAAQRARRLLDQGAYAEAERQASELVAQSQGTEAQPTRDYVRALQLLTEALTANGKAGAASTLAIAERGLRVTERLLGPDHVDTAEAIDNLGTVNLERGEFLTALSRYERARAIREKVLPANSTQLADSLDRLSLALIRVQRYEEARQTLSRAVAIRESKAGEAPVPLARTLELVGWLNRYTGDYSAAMPPVLRALELLRRFSPNHPAIVSSMELRGDLEWFQGHIGDAQGTWREALALEERTLGAQHPMSVELQRRLALAANAFGNRTDARHLLEVALPHAEGVAAPCSPLLPAVLDDLANSVQYDGNYAQARTLFQRALTLRQRCLSPNHSLTATVVHNQALLAEETGDFAEAVRLHEKALQMWAGGLGPKHPYVARALDAVAAVLAARGQVARARILYARALAIREHTLGSDHPDVAWTMTNIANMSLKAGNLADASRYLDRAAEIYRTAGVSDQPDHLARLLELRGETARARGDFVAAQASFAEALSTREHIFGASHPLAAASRSSLASAQFALGAWGDAVASALAAEEAGRDHLRFTVRYLPERQALAYAAKRPKGLDLALSVVAAGQAPDAAGVFESVVQSRALILDELAARAQATAAVDPDLASLNAALVSARQRFANLMVRSLQGVEPVPRPLLDQARQEKEDAERAIAERSASARADLAHARAGLDDVRGALPSESALVSFVRYDRSVLSRSTTRSTVRTVPSYIAFVVGSGASGVTTIPLGSAALVDAAVHAWREQVSGRSIANPADIRAAELAYRQAGTVLRKRIWDPLVRPLGNASRVLIVPDGALNLVSFATLPTGTSGYLAEQPRAIHYLSAERDAVPAESVTAAAGLLAVGGVAFDSHPAQPKSPAIALPEARRSICGSLASARFEDLPASREEMADIARIWSANATDRATVLTGRTATEDAVKKALAGHRVIHLATHGFFLGSDCDPTPSGTRAVGALISAKRTAQPIGENPLLLSGIALSGANNRVAATAAGDDGILTAEEVAALNLHGMEWAVLSACDTGLGEVRVGEGVLGLRRAFQIAGVRTVIMSLWSVDDDATLAWMRALYAARLQNKLSTTDAVREATLTVLRARRARRLSMHPFYWGGFVAAGDWR